MKPKKKTCNVCQKERYMYSKGRCKECASLEYAKKTQEKQLQKAKEKPAKSLKVPTERHTKAKDAERVAMAAFWESQRDTFDHVHCKECQFQEKSWAFTSVGIEFNPYNVAHIISKGSNPRFRCDMRNYIILCAEHHNQFDGGKRTEMKVYEETEKIRQMLHFEDSKNV